MVSLIGGSVRSNVKSVSSCTEIENAINEGNDLFLLSFLQNHINVLIDVISEDFTVFPLKDFYIKPYLKFNIYDLARRVCKKIESQERIMKKLYKIR